MSPPIKVRSKEVRTSISVSPTTKLELEQFGIGGETHNEILKKVLKLVRNTISHSDTQIKGNNKLLGTRYGQLHKTFEIETERGQYSVVCTYNDLSFLPLILKTQPIEDLYSNEWEFNLEIVNIKVKKHQSRIEKNEWMSPNVFSNEDHQEFKLLYLIILKSLIQETFGIVLFEIETIPDYFNYEKWRYAYKRNKLSLQSLDRDLERKLH
jgi:hypothetical protein